MAPMLALQDFNQEFVVETDVFGVGVGAILTQGGRPITFYSKALAPRHQALSIYEKEMLVVLLAVKKWNSYLVGRHFQIKTDHQSLKFLLDQQTTTLAQQLWVTKMMGYDYEVVYRSGKSNTVADILSWKPKVVEGQLMSISTVTTDLLQRIKESWL